MSFSKKLETEVRINREEDFDVQDSTTITLEDNHHYVPGAPLTTSKQFIAENNNVAIGSGTYSPMNMWTYSGSGDMFTGNDISSFEHRFHAISAPNANQIYNFSSSTPLKGIFQIEDVIYRSASPTTRIALKFGTFNNLNSILVANSSASLDVNGQNSIGVDDGITITGTTLILSLIKFAQATSNPSCRFLDYRGATFGVFEITNMFSLSDVSGPVWITGDRLSSNINPGVIAAISDCEVINLPGGDITPLEGVDSKDIRYRFLNSEPVPDSTVAAKLKIESNASTTVMAAAGTPTPINALWVDGEVEERMCFGDKFVADFTTDTLTTEDGAIDTNGGSPFNHDFTNGDTLQLLENGGLPTGLSEDTEYYVGNVTATTFQLFPDDTLTTPVDFSDNGTGINYYCHTQGNSQSGWAIYVAENTTDIRIEGWASIQKVGGGTVGVRAVIMETDVDYNVSVRENGAEVDASNTILSSSQVTDIKRTAQKEGFIVYVENITGTTDNNITNAIVALSKA